MLLVLRVLIASISDMAGAFEVSYTMYFLWFSSKQRTSKTCRATPRLFT